MASVAGVLAGLGGEGAQLEQARQRRITEALAAAQEKRTQQESELRQRRESAPEAQMVTRPDGIYIIKRNPLTGAVTEQKLNMPPNPPKPLGAPLKAGDGNYYQRYVDDNGKITTEKVDVPGGVPQSRADKFGSFVADRNSPTGYSRDILDGTTLSPTGRKDYGVPAGYLPKYHTQFKVMTDLDGNQYLSEVTTETGGSRGGGATRTGGTTRPQGTTGGTSATPEGIPKGAIPFGHKPLDAMGRRSLIAANGAKRGEDRLLRIYNVRPELKSNNSPITPAVSWLEYQHLHFEPPEPNATLIREAALIGITAAGLYSQGRMSRYLFEKAQQHLPQPNDSPRLLYEKIQWLHNNHILEDMIEDIKHPTREEDKVEGTVIINGKTIKVGGKD